MDLFRERHIPETECGPSQKARMALGETHPQSVGHLRGQEALKNGVVSFYGLDNFIG